MSGLTLFVLGSESVGKSTLVEQLHQFSRLSRCLTIEEIRVVPTTGQELSSVDLRSSHSAELRELGGRMTSAWSRFVATHESGSRRLALLYVVDATSRWQYPLSVVELCSLIKSVTWVGVKVVLCKSMLAVWPPNASALLEATEVFSPLLHSRSDVHLVDPWCGVGLDDVYKWLPTLC